MANDDRLKQYSEAGEEFLEAARSRAVEFLRELGRMSQTTQRQAQEQVDDLVDAGRRGTDQVLEVIRKEIAAQLGQLGLATKADLADLERRLTAAADRRSPSAGPAQGAPPAKATVPTSKPATKRAAPRTAATATAAGKSTASKAAGHDPAAYKSAATKGATARKAPARRAPSA